MISQPFLDRLVSQEKIACGRASAVPLASMDSCHSGAGGFPGVSWPRKAIFGLAQERHLGSKTAVGGLGRWEQATGSTRSDWNAPADNLWHLHLKRIAPFIVLCIDVPSSVHNTVVWELLLVRSQSNPLFFVFWSLPACAESTVAVINSGRTADSLWKTITYGCRVLLKARFMGSSMSSWQLLTSFFWKGRLDFYFFIFW